jgi:hypothetical protein
METSATGRPRWVARRRTVIPGLLLLVADGDG